MNARMFDLLKRANISATSIEPRASSVLSSIIVVGDSVFLKEEYQKSGHVEPADFQDRTGYESFINHVHLPYDSTRESLLSCLQYATALQKILSELDETAPFLIIVSISDNDCVVRFHLRRPNQAWLADDLEKYTEEAILILST